jgi:hypothetical protein
MCLTRHHLNEKMIDYEVLSSPDRCTLHDIPGVQTPGYSNAVFQTINASDSVIRDTLGIIIIFENNLA